MKKRVLSILLVVAMSFSQMPAAYAATLDAEKTATAVDEVAEDQDSEVEEVENDVDSVIGEAITKESEETEESAIKLASTTDTVTVSGTYCYEAAYEVLEIVNEERAAEGLGALTMDADLLEAAMQRAAEINLYFSHTRPTGETCFTISSKAFGENIAAGQSSATSVMTSWMNSSGHRANILTSSYQSIGIGCFTQGGVLYWVQLFGNGEATVKAQPSDTSVDATVSFNSDLEDWTMLLYLSAGSGSYYGYKSTVCVDGSRYIEAHVDNPGWSAVYCKINASSLTWTSASKSYVTVSSAGKLTGVSAGSSVITATTSGGTLSASKTITAITTVKPTISSAANASTGIKVAWTTTSDDGYDAVKYYVYRKASGDSSYTKVKTTTSTSWTDTDVTSGTKYTYKIKALLEDESTTSYSDTASRTFSAPTTISATSNTSSGIKVTWSSVSGAANYYVYRKASSESSYTKVQTTTSTSWTDTSATAGTTYTYKVKAVTSSGSASAYSSAVSIRRLTKTTVTDKNVSTGVKVSWTKVTGASGYYVYRKTGSGSYSKIKTISSGSTLNYTDTSVKNKNGTTYTYKVVAYYKNSSGSVSSTSAAATKTIRRLTGTSLSSVTNSASEKMTVKWSKGSKITGYQIQYSTSSSFSSYKTVKVTSASTVKKTISSLTKGKTYYVRIRTYYKTSSGTTYYSAWSTKTSVKIKK